MLGQEELNFNKITNKIPLESPQICNMNSTNIFHYFTSRIDVLFVN